MCIPAPKGKQKRYSILSGGIKRLLSLSSAGVTAVRARKSDVHASCSAPLKRERDRAAKPIPKHGNFRGS